MPRQHTQLLYIVGTRYSAQGDSGSQLEGVHG